SDGPGRGAMFTVRLPRVRPTLTPAEPRSAKGPGTAHRRILVIEDNEDAREMLKVWLARMGHKVHDTAYGAAGVDMASVLEPDVVLIDVGLPVLDGYEVARRIRAGKGGQSMRLVAITGYGLVDDRRRALEAGFDVHLTKPLVLDQLLK